MNALNRLGLKATAITLGVVLFIYGAYWGIRWLWGGEVRQETQEARDEVVPIQREDRDQDGLPDSFENLYRTNPEQADTDGDGTNDFDEVAAGRDPALAAPNDEVRPELGEEVTDTSTYTGRYLSGLPKDLSREEILAQERLEAFMALERGPLLSELPAGTVRTTQATGKEAVVAYLNRISAAHNQELAAVSNETIQAALETYLAGNPQELQQTVAQLEKNSGVLKGVAAPTEAADLHRELIQATDALLANVKLLLTMKEDFVAGLIASKNIDELGGIFERLGQQVRDLEAQYGIEV